MTTRPGLWAVMLATVFTLAGCASTRCADRPLGALARPPLPAGVQHAEGRFDGVRGVCLFEQSWRPTTPPRAVLVVVHGLKDESDRYAAAADALAQRGYAVYAYDQRGHGLSGGGRGYVASFDDYLDDLDRFMARVRAREPGRPVFLFGHSMGGAVVALDALARRPALAGLIVSAPALRVTPDVSPGAVTMTHVLGALAPGLAVMHLDPRGFSRDPAVLGANARDPLVQHGDLPARTASQIVTAMERIRTLAPTLRTPLLAMHGSADRITNPAGTRELYARAQGDADRTLLVLPGLYHDLLHEPEGATVLEAMAHWMDARSAAP